LKDDVGTNCKFAPARVSSVEQGWGRQYSPFPN